MPPATTLFQIFGGPKLYRDVNRTEPLLDGREIPDGARAERDSETGQLSHVTLIDILGTPSGFVLTEFLEPFQGDPQGDNPFPQLGANVFVLRVQRLREEKRDGVRRTVSNYTTYYNGRRIEGVEGNIVEPRGPGNNSQQGSADDLRIKAGTYPLQVQGAVTGPPNTKYRTFNYRTDWERPRPAVLATHTGSRDGILFHPAGQFMWSEGCLNITSNIHDASDDIDQADSMRRVIALIDVLREQLGAERFPERDFAPIKDAYLVVEGEPSASGRPLQPSWYAAPEVMRNRSVARETVSPEANIGASELDGAEVYDVLLQTSIEAKDWSDGGLSILEHMIATNASRLAGITGPNGRTLWHLWVLFWNDVQNIPATDQRQDGERRLLAVAERLKAAGIDINGQGSDLPPIVTAAKIDASGAIAVLHRLGADVNRPDRLGRGALHVAGMLGANSSFKTLLALGADKTQKVRPPDPSWLARDRGTMESLDTSLTGATVAQAISTGSILSGIPSRRSSFEQMMHTIEGRERKGIFRRLFRR
jgi:hypothetical protein